MVSFTHGRLQHKAIWQFFIIKTYLAISIIVEEITMSSANNSNASYEQKNNLLLLFGSKVYLSMFHNGDFIKECFSL